MKNNGKIFYLTVTEKILQIESIAIFLFFTLSKKAYAQFCNKVPGPGGIKYATDFNCVEDIFANILNIVMAGAILMFFLMLTSGGLKWMTSSGDPKDLENAKGRMMFGVFGLGLMGLGWFILRFISNFLHVPQLLFFDIPNP